VPCGRQRLARPPSSTTRPTIGSSAEGGSLARAREQRLDALCERLGHRFARPELLRQALTHSSLANEAGDLALGNERLEFLGDAVLGLGVAELLMAAFPEASEGALSRARAQTVNQSALAAHARDLGLDALLLLGRTEEMGAGRAKPSILADSFEAVLGALYLDAGLEKARAFVAREFAAELRTSSDAQRDAKTRLQELLQAAGGEPPRYVTVSASGPAHAREFSVEARVGERVYGKGVGPSKQIAEQAAARDSLCTLAHERS
jgi:ribonuclease-3